MIWIAACTNTHADDTHTDLDAHVILAARMNAHKRMMHISHSPRLTRQ